MYRTWHVKAPSRNWRASNQEAHMQKIDLETGLEYLTKTVGEKDTFYVDISQYGGSDTSHTSVTVTATARGKVTQVAAPTLGTPSLSSSIYSFTIDSGTDGEDYTIKLAYTGNSGTKYEVYKLLKVRNIP